METGASKCYAEATKLGTEESLMSLTLQTSIDSSGVDAATRISTAMGVVDEKVSVKSQNKHVMAAVTIMQLMGANQVQPAA